MANLAALAAARQTKEDSLGRLRMYASSATHFSITKAVALLGIGRENMQNVAVDEHFKMRMDDLVAKITADTEAGYVPFCVVANAGTVDTGAVDPLREIREVANRFELWMHVDGSYGAFAILAQSARKLFAGMEQADSIALDPHNAQSVDAVERSGPRSLERGDRKQSCVCAPSRVDGASQRRLRDGGARRAFDLLFPSCTGAAQKSIA